MLAAVTFCALVLCLVPAKAAKETLYDWTNFTSQFNKKYTSDEEEMRKSIFHYNVQKIKRHNEEAAQGVHTHLLGVNPFSDLTPEEFRSVMNKLLKYFEQHKDADGGMYFEDGEDYEPQVPDRLLPTQVDWRAKDVLGQVRDQGACGCCWAFSAVGAMEAAWTLKYGEKVNLSVQNLLDCTVDDATFGCEGGNMDSAFQYAITNNGLDSEECYRYDQKRHSRCHYKKRCRAATFKKFYDIKAGDEMMLKEALATQGPISVAMNADMPDFQQYESGVYSSPNCQSDVSHGVLLVGYGTTDDGTDYWIVRNSWGTDWGLGGDFLLARNMDMCGIAEMASFPAA